MKFYKVINPTNKPLLVNNELLTEKELDRIKLPQKIISNNNIFKEVNVSKFDTYWFFGCRFQNGTWSKSN